MKIEVSSAKLKLTSLRKYTGSFLDEQQKPNLRQKRAPALAIAALASAGLSEVEFY